MGKCMLAFPQTIIILRTYHSNKKYGVTLKESVVVRQTAVKRKLIPVSAYRKIFSLGGLEIFFNPAKMSFKPNSFSPRPFCNSEDTLSS
jgi:hypothetical protein